MCAPSLNEKKYGIDRAILHKHDTSAYVHAALHSAGRVRRDADDHDGRGGHNRQVHRPVEAHVVEDGGEDDGDGEAMQIDG